MPEYISEYIYHFELVQHYLTLSATFMYGYDQ